MTMTYDKARNIEIWTEILYYLKNGAMHTRRDGRIVYFADAGYYACGGLCRIVSNLLEQGIISYDEEEYLMDVISKEVAQVNWWKKISYMGKPYDPLPRIKFVKKMLKTLGA
jgi:hypothetical protein